MATKRSKKQRGTARQPSKKTQSQPSANWRSRLKHRVLAPHRWLESLKARRPHRSFRRTCRRDYARQLALPGYVAFTAQTIRLLKDHRRVFISLILTFSILTILLGGLSAQNTYDVLGDAFSETDTAVDGATRIGTLALSLATASPSSEVQQVYVGFMVVMVWLATVWLLREFMAGRLPKFRDALYSAGAPLIASVVLVLVMLVQLIPAGIVALAYTALSQVGLIDGGLGAMLFFCISALVLALTLFWLTTTFFALVIVTLPGMYPWRAMRSAADIVIGRRLRILYRLLWLLASILLLWALVLLPTVALDQWLRSMIDWWGSVPFVSIITVVMGTITTVWASAYVYHLYRKVVAQDAA